ncbi:hypothetical protein EVAR_53763_1 [Eumeta japonica]|uniref:Uncharacterized protein n=1 Tax=Eumeta variegata TaxID=151549 RepID=A0A4C1Z6S5_EUMVA|nr:hypothetical protein EVAR_53763_1 [Eumeta japonica]
METPRRVAKGHQKFTECEEGLGLTAGEQTATAAESEIGRRRRAGGGGARPSCSCRPESFVALITLDSTFIARGAAFRSRRADCFTAD